MNLKGSPVPAISSIHVEGDFRNPFFGFSVHVVWTFPYLRHCYHFPYAIVYKVVNVSVAITKNIKYVLVMLLVLKISSSIPLSRFLFNALRMTCRSLHINCCLWTHLHVYAT
jgi:hypothetical protein